MLLWFWFVYHNDSIGSHERHGDKKKKKVFYFSNLSPISCKKTSVYAHLHTHVHVCPKCHSLIQGIDCLTSSKYGVHRASMRASRLGCVPSGEDISGSILAGTFPPFFRKNTRKKEWGSYLLYLVISFSPLSFSLSLAYK